MASYSGDRYADQRYAGDPTSANVAITGITANISVAAIPGTIVAGSSGGSGAGGRYSTYLCRICGLYETNDPEIPEALICSCASDVPRQREEDLLVLAGAL